MYIKVEKKLYMYDKFIDLRSTRLYMQMRILDKKTNKPIDATHTVGPVNLVPASCFRQLEVYLEELDTAR